MIDNKPILAGRPVRSAWPAPTRSLVRSGGIRLCAGLYLAGYCEANACQFRQPELLRRPKREGATMRESVDRQRRLRCQLNRVILALRCLSQAARDALLNACAAPLSCQATEAIGAMPNETQHACTQCGVNMCPAADSDSHAGRTLRCPQK